ncbi:MAG: hypothetical protein A2234_08380 [Elusimicrobia bacterium RIFOXYA2_FULL_58_8]|nr:MAG: hypothetical protein A2285_07110 [Elusimicrobia bacterium RIFOXYA12_FULL_57_11]OGS17088.1 MAG: hypothetical protein A2234_08380 [Elusimicrobia bacterium RIFOXYA2_FULL_58_8]
MTENKSVIRCPKCGHEPRLVSGTCEKCGAVLEKQCGSCGFSNSVEKNYCDQCGTALALITQRTPGKPPPPSKEIPQLEIQGIQDTINERDHSFRQRQHPDEPAPPPAPAAQPPAAEKPLTRPGPQQEPAPPPAAASGIKKITGPLVGLSLLAAVAVIIYMVVIPFLPRLRLTMTAKEYLTDLSQGKYEKAYGLLSTNSKAACTLEDYITYNEEYYEKVPAWQFRNAQVFTMTKTAAMIRYELKEAGGAWKTDYLSFVLEHGRWTRPYIWMLFQPIDEAMARRDFVQALFLSQKLYLTDPIDPRASAYLCSSEFFMGLYEKAAESCSRTITAAAAYPVGYTSSELYWFNLYYADSLRYLERNRAALEEYEKMLKLPNLTVEEQCPLFLNRADVYVNIKDYEKGLADIMRAETACTQSPSKEDTAKRLAYMGGGAAEEAINFAKNSRLGQGAQTVSGARRKQLEELAARLGKKNARLLPKDQWLAIHLAGPEYRVFLRQEALNPVSRKKETTDIFIFFVNLWTRQGKVETAPAGYAGPQ